MPAPLRPMTPIASPAFDLEAHAVEGLNDAVRTPFAGRPANDPLLERRDSSFGLDPKLERDVPEFDYWARRRRFHRCS